jgi:4-amino-4-deoxy-L-arabinose transferase-like glycosyltransferase
LQITAAELPTSHPSPQPSPSRGEGAKLLHIAVFLAALLQFCLFLNHRDITTAHEGRVAATAREMIATGDWLIPHANGVIRLQKPPLPYWATALAWHIGGEQSVWLARLPAALCGAISALLIASIARQLLGRTAAPIAAMVWISTWFIVDEYRKAMPDPYLAFFTLLTVWSWIKADRLARRRGNVSSRGPVTGMILLAYAAAGLGFMAKGPPVLLHLVLAIVSYHVVRRRWPRCRTAHAIGVILFLAICVPWPAYVLRQVPGAVSSWRTELRAEAATSGEKASSPVHYLVALPLTSAPWTAFGVIAILVVLTRRRPCDRRLLWPLAWLTLTVVAFSLAPMKKNTYLLPAMPAQTLLIAGAIAEMLRPRKIPANGSTGDRLLMSAHAIAAGIAVCVTLFLVLSLASLDLERPGPLLAACGVGVFLVVGSRSLSARLLSLRTLMLTAFGFALVVHGVEAWLVPDHDNRRSEARFAESVNARVDGQPLYLIGPGLREDVLYYLGRTVPVLPSLDALPAGYRGFAIVTVDHYETVNRAGIADEIAISAERPAKDRLYLMQFPKNPNPPMRER